MVCNKITRIMCVCTMAACRTEGDPHQCKKSVGQCVQIIWANHNKSTAFNVLGKVKAGRSHLGLTAQMASFQKGETTFLPECGAAQVGTCWECEGNVYRQWQGQYGEGHCLAWGMPRGVT